MTLDLILMILANSVFHPWITMIFYLCIAAMHKHKEPIANYTLYWTGVLAVVEVSMWISQRITFGKHREVKWEDEVVVITGGAQGLGRVLTEMIVRKGGRVAVLDVKEPDQSAEEEMERWDLVWEKVDVCDAQAVKEAVGRVVDEVSFKRFYLSTTTF